MTGTFRNRKNGRLYSVAQTARDCTNARDGNTVVIYYCIDTGGGPFVRDLDEFAEKFDPYVEPPRCAHTDAGPDRLAGWMRCPSCFLVWRP